MSKPKASSAGDKVSRPSGGDRGGASRGGGGGGGKGKRGR
jgi:hypothetical protein